MRTIALIATFVAIAILPAAALAVEFVSVDAVADCNGWSSDVVIWFRAGARSVDLTYDVVLAAADGTEIERFTGGGALPISPELEVTFTYAGAFAAAPPAGCTLTGTYVLRDIFTDGFNTFTSGFLAAPACDPVVDPAGAPCTHSARWWHRNRDAWPTDELDVAGETWDLRTLDRVLSRPAWGNLRMLLARQLVAARFNAMMNPGLAPAAALDAADAFLAENDPFDRGRRGMRNRWRNLRHEAAEVHALMQPLVAFNSLGCTVPTAAGDGDDEVGDLQLVQKALAGEVLDPGVTEDVSFGTVKARFR
ncbi:MAG TPA: hypothetical protein PLQ13_07795 [Candidatus Krumholzibacteria bacterium]|nr:hypothetical protein [Candidatus Krumholzibacteria bacterium]